MSHSNDMFLKSSTLILCSCTIEMVAQFTNASTSIEDTIIVETMENLLQMVFIVFLVVPRPIVFS